MDLSNEVIPPGEYGAMDGVMNEGGYIPVKRVQRFALGLDIGQSIDPSAVAIVEYVREPIPPPEGIGANLIQTLGPAAFHVRHLSRLPLSMSYPAQVAQVGALLSRAPLKGNVTFALDKTGVGRPVFDLFQAAGLDPRGITITAGEHERTDPNGYGYHVAKIALVGTMQALLHSGELKIAKSLPESVTLANELSNFRATISDSGNASFGARIGQHDDLLLATAICCWILKNHERNRWTVEPLPWL